MLRGLEVRSVAAPVLTMIIALLLFGGCNKGPVVKLDTVFVNYDTCPISDLPFSSCDSSTPRKGVAYIHNGRGVKVLQVIDGRGVLVDTMNRGSNPMFVATKKNYIDDSTLGMGMYVSVGRCQYPSVSGAIRTVWAFDEMPDDVYRKRHQALLEAQAAEELKRRQIEERQRVERELAEAAERRAREAVEEEMARQRAENDRKLAAARIEAAKKAEQERVERERIEAEERAKRYPIEQQQRKEYAALKLGKISLSLSSYVVVQRDLLNYLSAAEVTELDWKELKSLQRSGDWLGMLGKIRGSDLPDYPSSENIDKAVDDLLGRQFHAMFVPTHDNPIACYEKKKDKTFWKCHDTRAREMIVDFRMSDGVQKYVQCRFSDGVNSCDYKVTQIQEKLASRMSTIDHDVALGKVKRDKADELREQEIESALATYEQWLRTSRVDPGSRLKGAGAPVSRQTSSEYASAVSGASATRNAAAVCKKCNGQKYIKVNEQCRVCGGTGTIVTAPKKLITGYSSGRVSKCSSCSGKGTIIRTVPCPSCGGR